MTRVEEGLTEVFSEELPRGSQAVRQRFILQKQAYENVEQAYIQKAKAYHDLQQGYEGLQ